MITPQRSTIKSRLHMEQSAFSQLVHFGLSKAINQEILVEGLVIKILDLQQQSCAIVKDEARHEFLASLYVERPQGWMPLKFTGDFQVNISWRWAASKHTPAVDISSLDISIDKKAKVDVGWLKVGIPQVIKNKLLDNVNEQIPQIESRVNQLVSENINQLLKKPITIDLPADVPLQQPAIQIQRVEYFNVLAENEIVFDVDIALWSGLPQQLQVADAQLLRSTSTQDEKSSLLKFGVTYEIFSRLLAGVKIPLGSRGELMINSIHCNYHDSQTMHFRVDVAGAVDGAITGLLQNGTSNLFQVEFKAFELELKNKLLDFGASLFEGKIRDKVESELNTQIRALQEKGIEYSRNQLLELKDNVVVDYDALTPEHVMVNGKFTDVGVVLNLETSVPNVIRVKDLSPWLNAGRV